jgi:hypothetical protein
MLIEEENQPIVGGEGKPDLGAVLVLLLKGVLYREPDPRRWSHLLELQNSVRDYVAVLGLELVLDEAEGYAFLQSQERLEGDSEQPGGTEELPRLIARRQLSFPVSLLLALLRKKLAEFDASGAETRLVLSREEIVDIIRLFLLESSNEAKLVDQVERHINRVVELGFLRKLKNSSPSSQPSYEVRRIIKAFIDAQWLSEFDRQLESYRQHLRREARDD